MRNVMKIFFKNGYIALFVALLSFCVGIEGKRASGTLASAPSTANFPTPARPAFQQAGAATTDEYVQSEAHMQVPEVKEKMARFNLRVPEDRAKPERPLTPNQIVTPYLNIVAEAINREVEFKNTHYAFYNGSTNVWRVPQDLYKKLYIHYKKPGSQLNDFVFVRFGGAKSIKAQDFLQEGIAKWGGVNDNIAEVRDVVTSMNLAIFGNVGFPGECTWNYFLEAKSHRVPLATNYLQVLQAFDLTYDMESLAKEAKDLESMLMEASYEQTLYQYFIPQNKADDVAYVAWILGFPAHPKSMALMEEKMKGKPRVGTFTGPAVKKVMQQFKKNKNDPVYKELLERAASGDLGIRAFMEGMRNDPFGIDNLNEIQGRLLVTNEIFYNPASGVKIFTYTTTPKNIQDDYMRKLDALAQKIISQEPSKTPEQKAADRDKNEKTAKRIRAEEEAKAKAAKK